MGIKCVHLLIGNFSILLVSFIGRWQRVYVRKNFKALCPNLIYTYSSRKI